MGLLGRHQGDHRLLRLTNPAGKESLGSRVVANLDTGGAQGGAKMPAARHEVTIGKPTVEVFTFIADGLNGPKWRTGIVDIAHVSGSGVGAIYKQGVLGPGGRRIDADYRVTAFEPNRRLAFEAIAGPVRPTGEYRLEEVDGGTRLTFSLQADLGGIKRLFMGGTVQKTMDAEVAATERLKQLLETPPPGQ